MLIILRQTLAAGASRFSSAQQPQKQRMADHGGVMLQHCSAGSTGPQAGNHLAASQALPVPFAPRGSPCSRGRRAWHHHTAGRWPGCGPRPQLARQHSAQGWDCPRLAPFLLLPPPRSPRPPHPPHQAVDPDHRPPAAADVAAIWRCRACLPLAAAPHLPEAAELLQMRGVPPGPCTEGWQQAEVRGGKAG